MKKLNNMYFIKYLYVFYIYLSYMYINIYLQCEKNNIYFICILHVTIIIIYNII